VSYLAMSIVAVDSNGLPLLTRVDSAQACYHSGLKKLHNKLTSLP